MKLPFAGGNFKHIMIDGFVLSDGIHRIGPFHAFDTSELQRILSQILEGAEGALLRFTIESIEPDECIDYTLKKRIEVRVFGSVPPDIEEELKRRLEDEGQDRRTLE